MRDFSRAGQGEEPRSRMVESSTMNMHALGVSEGEMMVGKY